MYMRARVYIYMCVCVCIFNLARDMRFRNSFPD